MRLPSSIAPVLLLAVASGCPSRDISGVDNDKEGEVLVAINIAQNRDVDVLFVVDDSSSMNDKQDLVAANFPNFIHVLEGIQGGLPNLHLGVTSSSVDVDFVINHCGAPADGLLLNAPRASGCAVPKDGARFISNIQQADGSRQANYDGQLEDVFACIARLGVEGCGYEQHLEGMKRALDGSRSENQGFLRSGAYLAVVILADEDDCSASNTAVFNPDPMKYSTYGPEGSFRCTEFGVRCDGANLPRKAGTYSTCTPRGDSYMADVGGYVDFLKSLKADPNLVLTAVIAGDTTPFAVTVDEKGVPELVHSCDFIINGQHNVADPAVRLAAFGKAFNDHGTVLSVCQGDYSAALRTIAELISNFVGVACLNGNVDVTDKKPAEVGLQLDCKVADAANPGSGAASAQLAQCPMVDATTPDTSAAPCWWAKIDEANCPTAAAPTHVELTIERNGELAPFGTHIEARCAINK